MDVPSISPKQSQQPSLDPKKNGSSLQGPEDFESNSDVDIEETNCDEPAETQSEDATLRKYLLPYEWVEMPPEEQRALFDQSEKDLRFRRLHKEKPPLQGSMCTVCAGNGHIGSGCPELLCEHCGAQDEHFSKACPTILSALGFSAPTKPYDWRSEVRRHTPHKRGILKAYCYHCGGRGHYGYDCPQLLSSQKGSPGSFSGVSAFQFVDQNDFNSLYSYNRDTKTLRNPKLRDFSHPATRSELGTLFDPFSSYVKTARSSARSPPRYPKGDRGGNNNRDNRDRGRFKGSRPKNQYQGRDRDRDRDRNRDRNAYRPIPAATTSNRRQCQR